MPAGDMNGAAEVVRDAVETVCCEARRQAIGPRWLLGVSGGRDSMLLLRVLAEHAPRAGLVLGVLHVHHGLRGAAADADAALVRRACAELDGVSFELARVNVPQRAAEAGLGIEDAARRERWAAARSCLVRGGWDAWVLAHHAGDRAEGVTLALLRGSGLRGLAGMQPVQRRDGWPILRPLLRVEPAALAACAQREGVPWREDASNRDRRFVRNWIRHELLPRLAEYEPAVRGRLVALAEHAAAVEAALAATAAGLDRLPDDPELARAWIRRAPGMAESWSWSRATWDRIRLEMGRAAAGRVPVTRGRWLVWEEGRPRTVVDEPESGAAPMSRSWRVPGTLSCGGLGVQLEACRADPSARPQRARQAPWRLPQQELICGEGVGLGADREAVWTVRTWRRGDRMRPWGGAGSQKLHDIFIDTKLPAGHRARFPVVETGGRIIWVVGYRCAEGLQWHEGCPAPIWLHARHVCAQLGPVVV